MKKSKKITEIWIASRIISSWTVRRILVQTARKYTYFYRILKKDGQYLKVKCDTYSSLASFYGDYQNNSKRLCWPIVERIKNNGGNKQNKKKTHAFMGKGGTCSGNAWKKSDEWERLIFEREKV